MRCIHMFRPLCHSLSVYNAIFGMFQLNVPIDLCINHEKTFQKKKYQNESIVLLFTSRLRL